MDMWSGMDTSKASNYSVRRKGHASMPMTSKEPEEVTPADHIPGPKQGEWTYSHYAALPNDGNRYEIIDGVLYMAPAPNEFHQETADLIATYLTMHVKFNHLGRVFCAPFDVELAENNLLQPDVLVVLKEHKERVRGHVLGAPDLVVEVASPRTWRYDRIQKSHNYALAGVKEYWIVDPVQCNVEVLLLDGSDYLSTGIFSGEQLVRSQVLPNLSVRAKQFFDYD